MRASVGPVDWFNLLFGRFQVRVIPVHCSGTPTLHSARAALLLPPPFTGATLPLTAVTGSRHLNRFVCAAFAHMTTALHHHFAFATHILCHTAAYIRLRRTRLHRAAACALCRAAHPSTLFLLCYLAFHYCATAPRHIRLRCTLRAPPPVPRGYAHVLPRIFLSTYHHTYTTARRHTLPVARSLLPPASAPRVATHCTLHHLRCAIPHFTYRYCLPACFASRSASPATHYYHLTLPTRLHY